MRISDWSSDVCSFDLVVRSGQHQTGVGPILRRDLFTHAGSVVVRQIQIDRSEILAESSLEIVVAGAGIIGQIVVTRGGAKRHAGLTDIPTATDLVVRSEEHTSELQSLMRTSYTVFCLTKKTHNNIRSRLIL